MHNNQMIAASALMSPPCRQSESRKQFSTEKNNNTNDSHNSNVRSKLQKKKNNCKSLTSRDEVTNKRSEQQSDAGRARIKDLEVQMNHFRQRLYHLPKLPSVWSSKDDKVTPDEGYNNLVLDAHKFFDKLQLEIQQAPLRQRFGRELTFLLEQSLLLFRTSFVDCKRVISLAMRYNLNLINQEPALEAACLEGKFDEAARLFSKQIDPDIAGFMPMEINVKEPLGLYAIARDAQERKIPIAEQVMDAVMSMAMVNPTDQNKYVLAAGLALGRVGAWKELVDYQHNSFNSVRLGQSLIGAVMYACILNGKREEALQQFDLLIERSGGVSSEWQWSGGDDIIDPIVRDIAMRVGCPHSFSLFMQAKREGFQVSVQALQAVIGWCSGPSEIFVIVDHLCHDTSWLVDGDDLNIGHYDDGTRRVEIPFEQLHMIMLPILRHCNHAGEFGLSILVYEMMSRHHLDSENWQRQLARRVSESVNRDETLAAVMTALCGLDSAGVACSLYENVLAHSSDQFPSSSDLYADARSIIPTSDKWHSAHALIAKLLHALRNLPEKSLTLKQTDTLLSALAKTARACNDARQPETAICLMRQVQRKIIKLQEVKPSVGGAVRSFLGIDPDELPEHAILARNDLLLAETMRAHRLRESGGCALTLLKTVRQASSIAYESIPLSFNQALKGLIADGNWGLAMELFHSLNPSAWTPDIFITLVKALATEQRWSTVGEMYHLSLKSGCLSEYVGITAMKAVVESEVDGKIRVVRGIAHETSVITGLVQNEWKYSRYWWLKRSLGIRYARLLMWWNDQRISDLQELELAIEQLNESIAAGRRPTFDLLKAIVRYCKDHERLSALINEFEMKLPAAKEAWAVLLQQVILAGQNSPQLNNKGFVEDIILALKAIDAHTMCDEFVSEALTRGVRVDKSILN